MCGGCHLVNTPPAEQSCLEKTSGVRKEWGRQLSLWPHPRWGRGSKRNLLACQATSPAFGHLKAQLAVTVTECNLGPTSGRGGVGGAEPFPCPYSSPSRTPDQTTCIIGPKELIL